MYDITRGLYTLLTYFIADLIASSPTNIFIIVKLAAQTSVLLLAHFCPCSPMKYNYVRVYTYTYVLNKFRQTSAGFKP